jgi:hypothetical protein
VSSLSSFVYRAMLRPPLTTILFTSQEKHSLPCDTTTPINNRKRVAFDTNGTLSHSSTDFKALSLADKHETRPSTLKMSSFTETLEVGSASGWNKVTLTRFGATFQIQEHSKLNTIITNPKFFEENTENTEFASRIPLFCKVDDPRISEARRRFFQPFL